MYQHDSTLRFFERLPLKCGSIVQNNINKHISRNPVLLNGISALNNKCFIRIEMKYFIIFQESCLHKMSHANTTQNQT